jgi:hypothetical protein
LTDYNGVYKYIWMAVEIVIARGFARNSGDERRLRAAGVTRPIYRADKGELPGQFKMRRGEFLGVVDSFLAFGAAKRDWTAAEKLVHSWGAVIYDVEAKLRSDQNGAMMFDYALRPRRPSETYQAMQAASVEKRTKDGRVGKRAAERIWRNQRLSVKEKVELTGWPQATLYNTFKKTNVPAGRRKK